MNEPEEVSEPVGMVLGTEDSTPLTFWVGIAPDSYLQLDDAVIVDTAVPGRGNVRIAGIVQDVRARHEGAQFDSDVFLVHEGVLPVDTAVAAEVVATRFEPEIFVPPMPGLLALRARGKDRDEAMYFDQMERRVVAGLTRDGEPVFLDLDFLDGSRGAHVNISGVSGVATKTTYALFLLYALFHSPVLGNYRANTKAIVFNVKGEDLMWLDTQNARLSEEDREDYPEHDATVVHGGYPVHDFEGLCELIRSQVEDEGSSWRGRLSDATVAAFIRRLDAARYRMGHLIWGREAEDPRAHRIDWEANQVTVVDIHNLHDRAKRFVTGVVIKRLFEHKERMGRREPLTFLVLDELNRYAPRDGWSPIKEVLLDVAERGRSLGMILIGAEQTASEVERRVIANSAFRVVGRLDTAESQRGEYGFLPAVTRSRASILKPGSMILQQPHIPIPLQIRFPFPCWATRADEAASEPAEGVFSAFEGD